MARKQTVLVIRDEDLKVRKRQAPPGKVEQNRKAYNRKREKRWDPDRETPLCFWGAAVVRSRFKAERLPFSTFQSKK